MQKGRTGQGAGVNGVLQHGVEAVGQVVQLRLGRALAAQVALLLDLHHTNAAMPQRTAAHCMRKPPSCVLECTGTLLEERTRREACIQLLHGACTASMHVILKGKR
jgi:hypothetical protein